MSNKNEFSIISLFSGRMLSKCSTAYVKVLEFGGGIFIVSQCAFSNQREFQ